MQKVLIIILAILSSGIFINLSYAETITTLATESTPGANCKCDAEPDKGKEFCSSAVKVPDRKYICEVKAGLAGFQEVFAKIIRFVVNIVLLLGVLAIVGLGIAWSFAGGDDIKAKSSLKSWGINIVIGLLILFMFRYILMFLAPWVYQ